MIAQDVLRLRHLGPASARKNGISAVLTCFFDDSADAKREEFVCVGGFATATRNIDPVSTESGWDAIELQWMDATSKLVKPFRSTDCETGHGQFEVWQKSERDDLFRRLTAIIASQFIVPVAFLVHVPDFQEEFPEIKAINGPYKLVSAAIMASLANYAIQEGQGINFTFEDSDADSGPTLETYKKLKSITSWSGAASLSGIAFADKAMPALQAADLLAREAFKHMDNLAVTARPIRKPLAAIYKRNFFRTVNKRGLAKFREWGWPSDLTLFAKNSKFLNDT